ncbi:MAG: apolipoprotein N-acyltransferase [Proteobacteria bacterium]|nr:apolipoprotein N-acyltransferase [Pseudomonadota bacterium]
MKLSDFLSSIHRNFLLTISKSWHRFLIAFTLGSLSALSFAPLFIFPALLLSLCGILFLLNQEIEKQVSLTKIFWLGWWFGFGHFIAGLHWITCALMVNLESVWWLVPFAFLGLPAVLAIFTGVSFSLTALWPYNGLSRGLAFGAIWIGLEWLRGHLFTGFPWNLLGYTWAFSPEMLQVASFAGVYGLSLLILLLAVSLTHVIGRNAFERILSFGICLMIGLGWVWGKYRLNHQDVLFSPPFAVRLVQPNVPEDQKKTLEQQESSFQLLLKMTAEPSSLPLRAIIWPESAVSFFLELDSSSRFLIAETLPKGALLFTGAFRRTELEGTPHKMWNSLFVVNDQGEIVTHYDKLHLVPFAEYIPFREAIDTLFGKGRVRTIMMGQDLTAGINSRSLSLPQEFPVCAGLICYEAIFPHTIINPTQVRPRWIINISNDAWFGNLSGPYQHFESARLRAIEEGIPLVRVANTGISAVFNAYGQPLGTLGLNKQGILDVFLPSPTSHVPFYGQWGDWITLVLIMVILAIAFFITFKRHQF